MFHDILSAAIPEIITAVQYVTRFGTISENITIQNHEHSTATTVSRFLNLSNGLNNILFAIRDQQARAAYRMGHDLGLLLGFCEDNQFIGWSSGRTVPTIQLLQALYSTHIGLGGTNIAFLLHMQRAMDMMFQLRMGISLYYHHIEP